MSGGVDEGSRGTEGEQQIYELKFIFKGAGRMAVFA